MLLSATYPSEGRTSVVENVDLKDGSSKQGNADRASVGWNLDVAMGTLSPAALVYEVW